MCIWLAAMSLFCEKKHILYSCFFWGLAGSEDNGLWPVLRMVYEKFNSIKTQVFQIQQETCDIMLYMCMIPVFRILSWMQLSHPFLTVALVCLL